MWQQRNVAAVGMCYGNFLACSSKSSNSAERYALDKAKMEFNSLNKEIGKRKKVGPGNAAVWSLFT